MTGAAAVVAGTRRARRDLEGAELTCPLTTPRPARAFVGVDTPAFIEACNKLGWAPWPGGRPADDCYPLVVLDPLPDNADAPPTLAIDMRAHLDDEDRGDGFVLTGAGDIERVEVTA